VDKISSEEVLQRINESKSMLDTVRKCRYVWLGYEALLRDNIKERTKGKATRGRKRMHLLSDVMKGHSKAQLKTGKSGRNC